MSDGEDSSPDAAATQLAAAGTRGEDGGATRGAPRSEVSDVAEQLTAAADSDLSSPADEPNPGPTPEEVAAAEAKKKLEEEAAAKKAAEEKAAADKKAADEAKAAADKKAAEARSADETPSRSAPRTTAVAGDDAFARLAKCESGGNAAINTGNGYYGAFQFDRRTWQGNGGTGLPHEHSYEEQKRIAQKLQAARGWSPWPACSRKLGL